MTQPVTPIPIITTPLDQPLGDIVPDWTPRSHPLSNPQYHIIQGQYCRHELLNSKTNDTTIQQLYDAFKLTEETHFTYLKYGPFTAVGEFKKLVHTKEQPSSDTILYTIFVNDIPVGFLSYLRISPDQGTIEIGGINFSQKLVQTQQGLNQFFYCYNLHLIRLVTDEWNGNVML